MPTIREVFPRGAYDWPSGLARAIATFRVTPEALQARTGIVLLPGCDELDQFRAAGLELVSGRRVLLLWHERAPVQELVLEADWADDVLEARSEAMAALGLSKAEVSWVPVADSPAT